MRIEEFDFSVDLLKSLQWQRNDSVNLIQLTQFKQNWYDENYTQFWQNWVANIFDLRTADAFGLSVWCIILQIPYFMIAVPSNDKPIFGFNEVPPININVNFENGNFTSSSYPEYTLSLEDQRIVCQLRYFQLISRGAIPEINQFLDYVFNNPEGTYQGGAWVLDNFDMTMTYVFNCNISNELYTVLVLYDILPRPAGVSLSYIRL